MRRFCFAYLLLVPVAALSLTLRPCVGQVTLTPSGRTAPPAESRVCPASTASALETSGTREGSAPIPLDSWIYPAIERLYALGYGDTVYLSLRPWTRQSALHLVEHAEAAIVRDGGRQSSQASEILDALLREFRREAGRSAHPRCVLGGLDSAYQRTLLIKGPTLNDSYHLGQTFANDYGRPYEPGFNAIAGASALAERGRFSFFIRGEMQHAPAAAGYDAPLADQLSGGDWIARTGPNRVQATIPAGPIATFTGFRLVEALASVHLAGHEISVGKSDAWLGPAEGGALAWSNNAENIYALHIDRVEPLYIPLLSRLLGPVRYQFLYGSLKGHTAPNSPYVHAESVAFHPTANFEFSFARTIIFGGEGHEAVTLHNFLRGFLSTSDTSPAIKNSPLDPGARFSDFSFAWRLPFVRRYATFYTDAFSHDDVTPISAPRRAAFRTGLYLAQIPHLPRLSVRAEAAVTDPRVSVSNAGTFFYFESIQKQGYTNKGFLLGDSIGREAKGGQFWLTWHLSGNEEITAEYFDKKNAKDFIPGGTTQNQLRIFLRKRIRRDVELDAALQGERWIAPVFNKDTGVPLFQPAAQRNLAATFQVIFYPSASVR